MDKRAWVHQLKKQVEAKGADSASWYVSWYDPDGNLRTKSCGPGKIGKAAAKQLADITHSQLVTGTYQTKARATWEKLRSDYMAKVASRFDEPSRLAAEIALKNFERVAKPKFVMAIRAEMIDEFTSKRLKEFASKGKADDTEADKQSRATVSPATVNKELRYIRLILNVAEEWGMIPKVPKVRFLKVPKKLPTFIPPEHFTAIYKACDVAKRPSTVPNVSPADWWRGLLVTGYMTGWRIGQLLSLKWDDVDLEEGFATSRAEVIGNKGKREIRIPLHPIVIVHMKKLRGGFDEHIFPWNQNKRDLWPEFHVIQEAARLDDGSPVPKGGKHGRRYGFHDVRRGFATENIESMDLFELQNLMQHKSLETTKEYVNMVKRLKKTVTKIFVPPNLQIGETG